MVVMKSWLGWDSSSDSKRSTRMGVTILKRCGCELRVASAAMLHSSLSGMSGSGSAISVSVAEGKEGTALGDHMNPLLHLGCFQRAIPRLLQSLTTLKSFAAFRLVGLPTDGAAVLVLTRV